MDSLNIDQTNNAHLYILHAVSLVMASLVDHTYHHKHSQNFPDLNRKVWVSYKSDVQCIGWR